LIAAAGALTAGMITSQAQVYSQNVVGYVNLPETANLTYAITVPFSIGVSNGANEIFPLVSGNPSVPDGSTFLVWTGNNYTTYFSDSGSSTLFDDYTGTPLTYDPIFKVGQGMYIIPAANTTNTFVGTVAIAAGATNSIPYTANGTFFIASQVPYGGYVTNGTSTGGGMALDANNGLPDGSTMLVWTGNNYTTYFSDSGSGSLWDDYTGTPIAAPPSIAVGQSFFLIPAANFTWTEGLSNQ
jgi:hypothetical protein